MSRPLNDDEVLSEMNKMVAFIKQEALEKAREIKVKADEEFAIEKAKLVKQETHAIDMLYEKKRKETEVAQKIAQSAQINKSRLRILQAREQCLQDLFSTAREKIQSLSQDQDKYQALLQGTVVEGALRMLEENVTLYSKKKDVSVVETAAEGAKGQYKEISGRTIIFSVEGELSSESAGGVVLIGNNKRIVINNTLDERLQLLEDKMLPEIRMDLFGINENRTFYN
ncbi:hypothetical protein Clacol_000251 [Clathrus columnatus]|uniref:V-type proton ATPase subunit E n=1 Tax=Clathrus columnatus TaxID=1419009 RepID=A0AAV4ZY49_9AGAM|nr:hypothetical protein Clacol_000251 [Clathrus columnatus]